MFFFRRFLLISAVITEKGLNEQKRLKTAEKSVSNSFQVCAAPESQSKYTAKGEINEERKYIPGKIEKERKEKYKGWKRTYKTG